MLTKDKVAFVCQRYGLEVNGGAELHCRQVAERLTPYYDVTVYTTCAQDYMTWKNEYTPGTESINGVTVKRYPVLREREQEPFVQLSSIVFNNPNHTDAQEEEWVDRQGPVCPEVLSALSNEHEQYKVVIFMTYLYYTTARGLPMGFPNAMLIPTVHDEPPVYLRYYAKVFGAARTIIWNTPVERDFATGRFPFLADTPGVIMGLGIEEPVHEEVALPPSIVNQKYIVYVGRVDESKGCRDMFNFFLHYNRQNRSELKLVLIGKAVMDVPEDPSIIQLGFVSDEMKFTVIKHSFALVLFSRYESLSMVVLESMMYGKPVIVNGLCPVLKGHCIQSNGGLYFTDYPEFAGILDYLQSHREQYLAMGENGREYVMKNYSWEVIIQKFRNLIDSFTISETVD